MRLLTYTALFGSVIFGSPAPNQMQRRCEFFVSSRNTVKFLESGNVNGTVQYCAKTQCCLGTFRLVDGHFSPDTLGCSVFEVPCPDALCSASTQVNNYTKCLCNSDFCNTNITWSPEAKQSQSLPSSQASGKVVLSDIAIIVFFGILMILVLLVMGQKLRPHLSHFAKKAASNKVWTSHYSYISAMSDIDVDSMKLQKIVGCGQYGTVWLSSYHGNVVALKVFPVKNLYQFAREKAVYTLPLMVHAGVEHFLGAGRKLSGEPVLVLKFASHGSLNSYLSKTVITWSDAVRLSKSLVEGLAYLHSDLHSNGKHKPAVAHRDLSSHNVLVQADGTCALCDFGCATILHCQWSTSQEPAPLGTLRYMPPEILDRSVDLSGGRCLLQGDVYALGLLLWEMWMRCSDLFPGQAVPEHHLPYEAELGRKPSLEQLLVFVFEKKGRPTVPSSWSKAPQPENFSLEEILEDCWDHDPEARLTAHCAAKRIGSLTTKYSLQREEEHLKHITT